MESEEEERGGELEKTPVSRLVDHDIIPEKLT